MRYIISGPLNPAQDTIYIPSSKSISNRMLVMCALSGGGIEPDNLSDSDDTRSLRKALSSPSDQVDIGHAGTAMRFLTAYFSIREGKVVITGSSRMKERPVGPLVEALRELGARINYLGRKGYPPLEIEGGLQQGGNITVEGGVSSQFISALMMIAPKLKGGVQITLRGEVVSSTYIQMTLALMKKGGIDASFDGRRVEVRPGPYDFGDFRVEADWSAASYWYQVAALLPGSRITLPNLGRESIQGDSVLPVLFDSLGVETRFGENEVMLVSGGKVRTDPFIHDFTGCPDLVQTLAVTLCALRIPFRFTGSRTLRIKETDRIAALRVELAKFGFQLETDAGGDRLSWNGEHTGSRTQPVVETYHDHRMAMAFAPLAIPFGPIHLCDPLVVSKSYPGFWGDLGKAGFALSETGTS